ncbi:hypothetical protein SAMN05421823_103105 [Catalinimonas alkaloidigena]|uniref:Secretion system C-terminal sorting domain-containing protein n=1 Tax=Catalinimonas alkaloidigena TaxID=1075417 RepID=A0A1G9DEP7_9BACT|nr:alkaline phosphatase PhoX [Catalinimonas alkaloidigena]SDK62358.1 hypothetical protein SAMN05421823_103105 [Catalinimonas alkaloidigena]
MKKLYVPLLAAAMATSAYGQSPFPVDISMADSADWNTSVVLHPSPLKYQVLFVGGLDSVATLDNAQHPNGFALAKEWHDFIGFTPDTASGTSDLGWISVNHEMILADDKIGDGGGMTVFKVQRDAATDTLVIVEQTLPDSRIGKFFNVDFVNTVGETGMNCGGITSDADGRIWTAEEWFQGSNSAISSNGGGITDTSNFEFMTDIAGLSGENGTMLPKYQNFNWMVEIDPRTASAVRKQYNWGRQGFEGGAVLPDNKTVYLGEDGTPGLFSKFIADTPGDFTSGKLYVYTYPGEEATGPDDYWVEVDNSDLDVMLNLSAGTDSAYGLKAGAAMFNRVEWVAYNKLDGKIYFTETGSDSPGKDLAEGAAKGGTMAPYWAKAYRMRYEAMTGEAFAGTDAEAIDSVLAGKFNNYYGRVLVYDPTTGEVDIVVEGGPYLPSSPEYAEYPVKHLANPDGINVMYINDKAYLTICEDLNGTSFGRTPEGVSNRTCELFMLDLAISNPTVNDLVRVSVVPLGAEVTGACPTPDGKTLLVDAQHPSDENPAPYNHSLTYAITGWDQAQITDAELPLDAEIGFQIYPNPISRELRLNVSSPTDVAIYDNMGRRVKVYRQVRSVDVSDLTSGVYYVRNAEGQTRKLIVQ